MDRGRFRSPGGRNDDDEGDEQYFVEDEHDSGDESYDSSPTERPLRKSRPSSPVPRRSHNPKQGTYRGELQGPRPVRPSQRPRREIEGRPEQETPREQQARRSQRPQETQRSQRPQRPREDFYAEQPRYARASRPPIHRQTSNRPRSQEDERYARQTRSTRPVTQPRRTQDFDYETRSLAPQRTSRPVRRRSRLPSLFGGCMIGIIVTIGVAAAAVFFFLRFSQGGGIPILGKGSSTQAFQQSNTQTLTISALTQFQICDAIGNVSVVLDQTAPASTITTTKIVHASSQANANQEFGRIGIAVQQPTSLPPTPSCASSSSSTSTPPPGTIPTPTPIVTTGSTQGSLSVQTTIPNGASLLRTTSDAVNVQIVLTPKVFSGALSLLQLDIEAPLGNINVNGLTGVLTIRGNTGDVSVTNSKLINGSHIGTGQGHVTFNGSLASPQDTTTDASFIIQAEKGQVDVTLPNAPTTNVVLSANTNVGTIHSDFPITPTTDGNAASFRGPLNASAAIQSIAVLTLNVSTGNINIYKS